MGPRKEKPLKRGAKGEGLKDPSTQLKEHVASETIVLEGYQFIMDQEDLSLF